MQDKELAELAYQLADSVLNYECDPYDHKWISGTGRWDYLYARAQQIMKHLNIPIKAEKGGKQ